MAAGTLITAVLTRRARARLWRWAALIAVAAVVGVPLLMVLLALSLFAGTPQAQCMAADGGAGVPVETGPAPAGLTPTERTLFSEPLQMQPGKWYPAGATYYEADDATGTGTVGAIPDPAQSNLLEHPDSFAELSLKTTNEGIDFTTADALGNLPWLTTLRVAYGGRSVLVSKRDIGYGQGAHTIDGQRFRIDLWAPAAHALGVTSSLVRLQLVPQGGAGNTLGEASQPISLETEAAGPICTMAPIAGGPLPLTEGERAKLLPNGLAAAPREAPETVKEMIAAGNQIVGRPYVWGGGHGLPLSELSPVYDCSSSVSHLLYGADLVDVDYTPASGTMAESFGLPGYGRWVSLLANAEHVYMYVAGLRWDTHLYGAGDQGVDGIGWHTERRDDVGFIPRHPRGL